MSKISHLTSMTPLNERQLEAIRARYLEQNRTLAQQNASLMMRCTGLENRIVALLKENTELKREVTRKDTDFNRRLDALQGGIEGLIALSKVVAPERVKRDVKKIQRKGINREDRILEEPDTTQSSLELSDLKSLPKQMSREVVSRLDSTSVELLKLPEVKALPLVEEVRVEKSREQVPKISQVYQPIESTEPLKLSTKDALISTEQRKPLKGLEKDQNVPLSPHRQHPKLSIEEVTSSESLNLLDQQAIKEESRRQAFEQLYQAVEKATRQNYSSTEPFKTGSHSLSSLIDVTHVSNQSGTETPKEHKLSTRNKGNIKRALLNSTPEKRLSLDLIPRSKRRRSEVNYKLPSLRDKMRRSSDKFFDAVYDKDDLIGDKENRKPGKTTTSSNRRKSSSLSQSGTTTKMKNTVLSENTSSSSNIIKSSGPLSDKTDANNNKQNPAETTRQDLLIFEFDEDDNVERRTIFRRRSVV